MGPNMHPEILFDLSRGERAILSGIDRVELAYAWYLIATAATA